MGNFIITLPNHQQGEVRWGTLRKMSMVWSFLKGHKSGNEPRKGYIVKMDAASSNEKEYRLLKTKDGHWTAADDGAFQVTPDDQISVAIKKAIDDYESQQREK